MARQGRIHAPGAVQHVTIRAITRDAIFYDDVDREAFLNRAAAVFTEARASCYAFALVAGHVHLLLRAGTTGVSDIMRRLLTGYSVSFNKRHKRSGHLFQNRYKSILCEEEPYLLPLVRRIHLNPLRAHEVPDFDSLDSYPYSGHSAVMGYCPREWLDRAYILMQFDEEAEMGRRLYRTFVEEGISEGRRDDLAGGGFARSNKGWRPSPHAGNLKSDERILGSSRFVVEVMRAAKETWDWGHRGAVTGADFAAVQERVAALFRLTPEEVLLAGKYPSRVAARSVLCYFLVRELGMTATEAAQRLGMGQPAVSIAVRRGEAIVRERGLRYREPACQADPTTSTTPS